MENRVGTMNQQMLNVFRSARMSRDARFDGQFYIAVKTTGIFCRPICPATLPKECNVEYFVDKAQAIQAGYRPCLRCRPDSAQDSWAWKGTETTFQRALTLIDQGSLQTSSLAELANRIGVSDRYLRQLFQKYLGMSPKQYALAHQLMFAKQLLHSSALSITDIAYASGFNSTRRFNDAFLKVLQLSPRQIRRSNDKSNLANSIELSFHGELDWQHMLDFYQLRVVKGLETVEVNSYQRYGQIDEKQVWFSAKKTTERSITVEFELEELTQLRQLVKQVRRLFDLDVNTTQIEQHLHAIEPSLIKQKGIRIPGVWSPWEAGVRAILGQQVSVKAAITHLNALVKTVKGEDVKAFPTPAEVASIDLSFLKMPQSRKETLTRFAQYMIEHPESDPDSWLCLKGIGPWTVSYAHLRGCSQPDCFLDNDLVVKKALNTFTHLTKQNVSPWGSYATFHCWSHA
ncbi:DNA-3-methyladenine glycosylase 2 family protein [Vibrio sp. TRT 21S02]|uniref:DNA-3-methyladenine glycosylase 2 family protein n=1 Tax=Vibrio sp. TRT 21S02 TaxID=3418507 RepID=UPI003CF75869